MRRDPKQADLVWSLEGDLMINDGLILDTKNQAIMHLYQSVRDRLMSSVGEWRYFPDRGMNLNSIIGKPVNPRTVEELKQVVTAALLQDGLMTLGEFTLDVTNSNPHIMGVTLDINSKRLSSRMQISFTYDARENRIALRSI